MSSLKIDPNLAKTMELEAWGEISSAVNGKMTTRGAEVWRSEDGNISMGIWECDAGTFKSNFAARGEFIHIVEGSMTCTSDDGTVTEIAAGDAMTFPKGWTGTWEVHTPLRKIYCDFK